MNQIHHHQSFNYQQRKQLINKKYRWIHHQSVLQEAESHQYIRINLNNKIMLIKKKEHFYHHLQSDLNVQIRRPIYSQHSTNLCHFSMKQSLTSLTTCKSMLNSKTKDNKKHLFDHKKRSFTESNQDESLKQVKMCLKRQGGFTQKINMKKEEEEIEPWKDDNK